MTKKRLPAPATRSALPSAGHTIELPLDLPSHPRGWEYLPLARVVDERRGISYGVVQPGSPAMTGVPIIRVNDIRRGRINDSDPLRVSPDIEAKHSRTRLQGGELLLTLVGTVGESAIVPKRLAGWNVARAVAVLPINGDISARWVHLCLRSAVLKHYMRIWCTTTVQATLNLRDVARLPIPVPPRQERERIAEILGTLDDKIELNRRMNDTLEAMARRLFRSWFIDFDPVHAKATVRREHPKLSDAEISRRALPKMTPEVARFFPDAFEDSAVGRIPKGWTVAKLVDHVEATRGLSYKGTGLADAGKPMHNLNSVYEGGGYKFEGIKFYTGEFKERHVIKAGEVLVANTEQGHDCLLLGYAAIVPDTFGPESLFSHHTYRMRIRTDSSLTPDFLCRLLNTQRMHELVSGFGNGTTVNMLPLDGVEQPEFCVPPSQVISAYSTLAKSVREREGQLIEENRCLAVTRDQLLSRLLSGELSADLPMADQK